MNLAVLRQSLALLPPDAKRKLALVVPALVFAALIDLLGVLLVAAVAAIALSAASGTPLPAFVESIVLRFPHDSGDTLYSAALVAVVAALLLVCKTLISAWLTLRMLRFLAYRQANVSGRLAGALLQGSLLAVQEKSTQAYAYALTNGVNAAVTGIVGSSLTILSETILLGVLTLGLLVVDPMVTLGAFLYFLFLALILQRFLSGRVAGLGHLNATTFIDSFRYVQDALVTYREIFVLDRRQPVLDRFAASRDASARSAADTQFVSQVPKFVLEIGLVVGGIVLTIALVSLRSPVEAAAVLALFLAAGTRVMPSIFRLQGATLAYRASEGPAQPTLELAALERQHNEGHLLQHGPWQAPSTRTAYDGFVPEVVVNDAVFTYPGQSNAAIDHVSLCASPGESLAIVGPSGAGKSTLADVLLGLVQLQEGTATISGVTPLRAIWRWPGAIAYVPQSVTVVEGSIRENVALGVPPEVIDEELVWEALSSAHLDEFVRSEREGLETFVGDRGTQLSGGQRQRLGIARALYSRPRLLILDEATSALDAETEVAISRTISDLGGKVTTIVIAHRLATVRSLDQVLYLERGRLVASGTFDQVRRASANFAEQARLLGL